MELLVVVLIIGILAAVAVPQYQKAVFKSRVAAAMPLAKALKDAQDRYYMANGVWATDPADLDITLPKNCTVKFWDKASDRTHMQCPGVEYVFREDAGRWAQVLLVINPQPSGVQKIRFVFPYAASSTHSCYQPYQEPYCEAWGSEAQYKDQQFCKMFSRPNEKKKVTCGEDLYVLPL